MKATLNKMKIQNVKKNQYVTKLENEEDDDDDYDEDDFDDDHDDEPVGKLMAVSSTQSKRRSFL